MHGLIIANTNELRIRKEPSLNGDIVGHTITNALYKFTEAIKNDDYTWYNIGNDEWIANVKNCLDVYITIEDYDTGIKEKTIAFLKACQENTNETLNAFIEDLNK